MYFLHSLSKVSCLPKIMNTTNNVTLLHYYYVVFCYPWFVKEPRRGSTFLVTADICMIFPWNTVFLPHGIELERMLSFSKGPF